MKLSTFMSSSDCTVTLRKTRARNSNARITFSGRCLLDTNANDTTKMIGIWTFSIHLATVLSVQGPSSSCHVVNLAGIWLPNPPPVTASKMVTVVRQAWGPGTGTFPSVVAVDDDVAPVAMALNGVMQLVSGSGSMSRRRGMCLTFTFHRNAPPSSDLTVASS